jgi:Protein of unknown function (DUF4231)
VHANREHDVESDLHAFVLNRIRHWHRKASLARFFALSLRAGQIILAGCLPILALTVPKAANPATSGIIGSVIVIVEGFQQSFRFEQFWTMYREWANRLANEERMFQFRAGPYESAANPQSMFASRVNTILDERLETWGRTVVDAMNPRNRGL